MASSDIRLGHVAMPNWQKGAKQALLGSEYVTVEPTTKITNVPVQLDFDLPSKESILFGHMSRFRIKGAFQTRATAADVWANVPATDVTKVLLAPNWLEMLIKEVSVFHNNYRIATSSELRHITPFVNAYLYHNMHPEIKGILCPQECHPAYCLPAVDGEWNLEAQKWKDYAAKALTGSAIEFDYTPLFLFPFFQGPNYVMDENTPRILPAPAMGRIQIRFAFTDSQDHIFRKPVTNTGLYRFAFTEFNMMVQEARLSPFFSKQLEHSKKFLAFPGVTRIQLVEPVPNTSTTYRARYQDVYLPESLFIFCLDKTVASGTFKFSGTGTTKTVFGPHNIQSIDLSFDGKRFSLREPHIGNILNDSLDMKQLFDHQEIPPFGIRQDLTKLTYRVVHEGCKNTPFPHVYLSLVTGPDRQRLIPTLDDGSCVHRKADLEINFKFTDANSPANVIFVIFAIFTDVNVVYDPKNKHFSSPYLQYMN